MGSQVETFGEYRHILCYHLNMALKQGIRAFLAGCSRLMTPKHSTMRCFSPSQSFSPQLRQLSDFSPSLSESYLPPSIFQPSVVIFDKDGTLVCFHTMWNSWCEELASRMCAETETDMSDDVYELMGYDSDTKKIRMGMLAEKTHPYIKEKVVEMLIKQGFSNWEAKKSTRQNLERHSRKHADKDDRKSTSSIYKTQREIYQDCHLYLGLKRRNSGVLGTLKSKSFGGYCSLWR